MNQILRLTRLVGAVAVLLLALGVPALAGNSSSSSSGGSSSGSSSSSSSNQSSFSGSSSGSSSSSSSSGSSGSSSGGSTTIIGGGSGGSTSGGSTSNSSTTKNSSTSNKASVNETPEASPSPTPAFTSVPERRSDEVSTSAYSEGGTNTGFLLAGIAGLGAVSLAGLAIFRRRS